MVEVTHDNDAELALLSAALHSKTARHEAGRAVSGRDFYQPAHERIWDAMTRLDRHDKPVDPVTVMAVVCDDAAVRPVMLELTSVYGSPDKAGAYAAIVRSWAVKRQMRALAEKVRDTALNPEANAVGFAASVAAKFAAIRDGGQDDDVTAKTLDEYADLPEQEFDWIVPDLLERGDRLILTGAEGLGKSTLLRQVAVYAAAGIHPFKPGRRIKPIKALVYDSENSEMQVKRKVRALHADAARRGQRDPGPHVMIDCPGRIDIARDRDLARLHRLLDAMQPDILVAGPLYRLHPRALQTDDEASPVLAALDTVKDRGIALLIEAHAGHLHGANGREWRPRGSSALMGWPEFGYGMSPREDTCELIPWRGARDERDWPKELVRDSSSMAWRDVSEQHWGRGNAWAETAAGGPREETA